nr:RNA-directed DNA polymerase, eukaryota [Tanacetum cinerariifolium]
MGAYNKNSLQSKADQTVRISKSIFGSNFPEGCTPKDLWKVLNGSSPVGVHGPSISFASVLVLDNSCVAERDLSNHVMAKEIPVVVNAKVMNNSQDVYKEVSCDNVDPNVVKKGGSVLGVMKDMIRVGKAIGLDHKTKKEWIKELTSKNKINFMAIQETKTHCVNHMDVKFMLLRKQPGDESHEVRSSLSLPPGFTPDVSVIRNENGQSAKEIPVVVNAKVMNNSQDVYKEASCDNVDPNVVKKGGEEVGNSGGILCVWEATLFKKDYATISDNFVAIYGTWLPSNSKVLFVAIYAPQQVSRKRLLWDYVSSLINRWNGKVVVLGDFNEVQNIDERRGSCFNPTSARVFDQFISASGLVDVKMEGLEGFDAMVEQTWRSFSHNDADKMIHFKKRFRTSRLLDGEDVSDSNLLRLSELHRNIYNINQMESKEYLQKSKIRWAIEGDENSKFFHGLINKKRSQLAIRGVFVDGIWCTNPNKVKEAFFKHFEARFKKPVNHRLKINFLFSKRLSDVQASDLERRVSRDEIRLAV